MTKGNDSGIYIAIFLFFTILFSGAAAMGEIIYVNDDAAGANDGSSWADAYIYLQEALADANAVEKPVEIRVAQGVYKPDQGAGIWLGDKEATFHLINGVTLKGGYEGFSEADPNARDIELYETILSGDLNGDDVEVDAPCDLLAEPARAENSYHVVNSHYCDESAILDGFTISGGNAYNPNDELAIFNSGGGMKNTASNPIINNCIFSENSAYWSGGGMSNDWESNPVLTNCTFSGNSVVQDGGGMSNEPNSNPILISCTFYWNSARSGGGMNNDESYSILTDCIFSRNSAESGGGILNNNRSNPALTDCTFRENFSSRDGGGMRNKQHSNPTVIKCRFSGNSSGWNGGGISNTHNSNPTLKNCILTGNTANLDGGGIYNTSNSPILINCTLSGNRAGNIGGGILQHSGSITLINCILWGDIPSELRTREPIPEESILPIYSNIQGGFPGEGNSDVDPYFANPGYWADVNDPNIVAEPNDPNAVWVDGDYHLKSQVGRWIPTGSARSGPARQDWVQDDVTSPCIDAGDPNSDWDGEVWPHGERINMGAYGGTEQASMSAEPQPLFLPSVAYIFYDEPGVAQSFESLLGTYGCSVTLINLTDVTQTAFDSYDVIVVGSDTGVSSMWSDDQSVIAIENSGKPIVGLGEGGYAFFGKLGLSIGYPKGAHSDNNSIYVVEPEQLLFSAPYAINIPDDGALQLYGETENISIYLPSMPENIIVLGREVDGPGYWPLVLENQRYLFWGFINSPEDMTETGKDLFTNSVILTANVAWETAIVD